MHRWCSPTRPQMLNYYYIFAFVILWSASTLASFQYAIKSFQSFSCIFIEAVAATHYILFNIAPSVRCPFAGCYNVCKTFRIEIEKFYVPQKWSKHISLDRTTHKVGHTLYRYVMCKKAFYDQLKSLLNYFHYLKKWKLCVTECAVHSNMPVVPVCAFNGQRLLTFTWPTTLNVQKKNKFSNT